MEEATSRLDSLFQELDTPDELIAAHTEVVSNLEHELSSVRAQRDLLDQQLTASESLSLQRLGIIREQKNVIAEQTMAIEQAEHALALALREARPGFFSWKGAGGDLVKMAGVAGLGYALGRIDG